MLRAFQAYVSGARAVARAPALVLIIYLALAFVVLPSAIALARTLDSSFEARVLERVNPGAVDESWFERAPVKSYVMGFAAQLTNLDDLIAARPRDALGTVPMLAWFAAWTFLLGGVLERLRVHTRLPARSFLAACVRCWPRFAVIGAATLMLYAMAAAVYASSPLGARLAILALLALVVGVATLIASYARVWIAMETATLRDAVSVAVRIVRAQPLVVATHALIAIASWMLLMLTLARVDASYGAGTGFWRPLIVGQAYVATRILQRLLWEASIVALVRAHLAVPPK